MDDPAVTLRKMLTGDRERGLAFERVWGVRLREVLDGVELIDRKGWALAFTDLEAVWRDAYDRTPQSSVSALSPELLVDAA